MFSFYIDPTVDCEARSYGRETLQQACEAEGVPYVTSVLEFNERESRYNFRGDHAYPPEHNPGLSGYQNVIFYGSIPFFSRCHSMFAYIADDPKEAFLFSNYASRIDDWMMNGDYHILPFGSFEKLDFVKLFGKKKYRRGIFIRPNSGWKPFTGLLLTEDNYNNELSSLKQIQRVRPEDLIVFAAGKKINAEYRFVVVGGKVVTGSEYRWDDKLDIRQDVDHRAEYIAESVAKVFRPETIDDAFVVDVAEYEGKYGVVELNLFNTSGLYACDRRAIMRAMVKNKLDIVKTFGYHRYVS